MKPIKYYYRFLYFGIIFPALVVSAALSSYYSWKNISSITSRVSSEIKPRIGAVVNSIVSSISAEIATEKKTIEKILLESERELERAIVLGKGYDVLDKELIKSKISPLLRNTLFTDLSFFVFNQKSEIKWSSESNFQIGKIFENPDFLSALTDELDIKGVCFYPFTFIEGSGRTLMFKRLINGDIFAISLIINPDLYLQDFRRIKDLSVFIEGVKIFNVYGTQILTEGGLTFVPLKWWEFYKRDLENTFYIQAFNGWSEPIKVLLRLNFLQMHTIFIFGVLTFFMLIILTFFVALNEYSVIRKDIRRVQSHLQKLNSYELPKVEVEKFKIKESSEVAMTLDSLVNKLKEEERKSVTLIIRTKEAFFDFAEKLALVAESYEHMTGEHLKRVKYLTGLIVNRLKIDRDYADEIINYSVLHDIGKIFIPIEILQVKRELTSEEWELARKHTIYGANLFTDSEFRIAKEICLYHHENYDGSGYPFGLKGEEIPLPGRIIRIVDVYDALRSERPYKKPYSHALSIKIMTEGDNITKPSDFDPVLMSIFIEEIEKIDYDNLYGER